MEESGARPFHPESSFHCYLFIILLYWIIQTNLARCCESFTIDIIFLLRVMILLLFSSPPRKNKNSSIQAKKTVFLILVSFEYSSINLTANRSWRKGDEREWRRRTTRKAMLPIKIQNSTPPPRCWRKDCLHIIIMIRSIKL